MLALQSVDIMLLAVPREDIKLNKRCVIVNAHEKRQLICHRKVSYARAVLVCEKMCGLDSSLRNHFEASSEICVNDTQLRR